MKTLIELETIDAKTITINMIAPYNFKHTVKDILENYDLRSGLSILNGRKNTKEPLALIINSDIYKVYTDTLIYTLEDNSIDLMSSPCDILLALKIVDKELLLGVILKGINWLKYEYTEKSRFKLYNMLYRHRIKTNNLMETSTLDCAKDLVKNSLVDLYNTKIIELKNKLNMHNKFIYRGIEIEYETYRLKKITDYTHIRIEFVIDSYGYEVYSLILDIFKGKDYEFK